MPAVFQKTVEQDLHKPLKIQYCADTVFTKDNAGNLINVLLFEDGEPYNGGGTVSATAIRADGATESWAGTISGNTVSVALTRAALDVPGTLQVFIKVTAGTVETTVYAGVYNVVCTETPTVVAPVTPSDVAALIASIEAAIRNIPADWTSFLGTIAPTFDPAKADGYAAGAYVWYPGQPDNVGTLYRFTSAHSGTWTGTDAVTVVIGNELNDTVRYTQQVHTDAEKTVARSNIGAADADDVVDLELTTVKVTPQTFDDNSKSQARSNIGAASSGDLNTLSTLVNNQGGYISDLNATIGTVPAGETVEGQITDLKIAIDDSIAESLTWTDGGYTKAYDTIELTSGYSYSSYIDVIPGHKYLIKTKIGGDASITFRDANNAGLAARFKNSESDPNYYNIITIPENAVKMRISCVKANKSTALVAHIYPDEISIINERLATAETAFSTIDDLSKEVFFDSFVIPTVNKGIDWSTGVENTNPSSNRLATGYIQYDKVFSASSSIVIAAYVYRNNGTFLGCWGGSTVAKGSALFTTEINLLEIKDVLEDDALKFRIVAKKTDNGDISSDTDAVLTGTIKGDVETLKLKVYNVEKVDQIKILFLGNSFTQDENAYLPALLKEALPGLKFTIGLLFYGGSSFVTHYNRYINEEDYAYYKYSSDDTQWSSVVYKTIQQGLADENWDILISNHAESTSDSYETYQPYLDKLIYMIQRDFGKNIKFGMLLYHAKGGSPSVSSAEFPLIAAAVQTAYNQTAISEIIPTGTAVENARTTSLKTLGVGSNLTYDESHLNEGLPCLIPAYVTLLKVCKWIGHEEIGIMGSQILPTTEWVTAQNIPGKHWADASVGATADNRFIAAQCAIAAIKKPFEITDCSGREVPQFE